MTSMFKAPKQEVAPAPEPLPPPPSRTDAETTKLAEEQRKRFGSGSMGRASTFLTGAGVSPGSSAVRFLGGASAT